jgi:hypothetical protein
MNKYVLTAAVLAFSSIAVAKDYVTPVDMPEDAYNEMYSIITEYNGCMMQGRLQPQPEAKSGQEAANLIMQSCEQHLTDLKQHLANNNVEPSLVEGMAKKMRSRAARQLMTETMNNLAAQAQAAGNAETMQKPTAE